MADTDPHNIADAQALMWSWRSRSKADRRQRRENELRAAQNALHNALASGAPKAEIDRLMQQMESALGRYLQALNADGRHQPQTASNDGRRAASLPTTSRK